MKKKIKLNRLQNMKGKSLHEIREKIFREFLVLKNKRVCDISFVVEKDREAHRSLSIYAKKQKRLRAFLEKYNGYFTVPQYGKSRVRFMAKGIMIFEGSLRILNPLDIAYGEICDDDYIYKSSFEIGEKFFAYDGKELGTFRVWWATRDAARRWLYYSEDKIRKDLIPYKRRRI